MITMTFNKALQIQRSQMCFYRQMVGRKGIKYIKERTIYPHDINPNEEIPVSDINRWVPRGAQFEYLFTKNWRNIEQCKDRLPWSEAIRKGLV